MIKYRRLAEYDQAQYDQHIWDYMFHGIVREILASPITESPMWKIYFTKPVDTSNRRGINNAAV